MRTLWGSARARIFAGPVVTVRSPSGVCRVGAMVTGGSPCQSMITTWRGAGGAVMAMRGWPVVSGSDFQVDTL